MDTQEARTIAATGPRRTACKADRTQLLVRRTAVPWPDEESRWTRETSSNLKSTDSASNQLSTLTDVINDQVPAAVV